MLVVMVKTLWYGWRIRDYSADVVLVMANTCWLRWRIFVGGDYVVIKDGKYFVVVMANMCGDGDGKYMVVIIWRIRGGGINKYMVVKMTNTW